MMASRPKGVLNQGTPAYAYGPLGVSVIIIRRSERERSSQALNCGLEVTIRVSPRCAASTDATSSPIASSYRTPAAGLGSAPGSQA